jgi:hypothetical protein
MTTHKLPEGAATIADAYGCGNHGCVFGALSGQGTNTSCRCLDRLEMRDPNRRARVGAGIRALRARVAKAERERDELLAAVHRLPVPPADDGDGPDERVGYILHRLKSLVMAYEVACRISREDAEHGTDADTGHPLDPRYLAAKAALDSGSGGAATRKDAVATPSGEAYQAAPGAADSTEGSD